MKNHPLFILSFMAMGLFSACNPDEEGDCDPNLSCNTFQPVDGELVVRVTIDADHPSVPIAIYFGPFESGVLALRDTLTTERQTYIVPIDEKMSVTAEYRDGADVIFAIDGDEVTSSSTVNCDSTCWTVQNAQVDLMLIP